MAVAALNHPAHAALVPMGFGVGIGRIGEWYEQGNFYRGGACQMLFTSALPRGLRQRGIHGAWKGLQALGQPDVDQ